MRLRAKVREVTDKACRNFMGEIVNGELQKKEALPAATWVDLTTDDGNCFLLYLDEELNGLSDSWYPSLAEAKESAFLQFKIEEKDWFEVVG